MKMLLNFDYVCEIFVLDLHSSHLTITSDMLENNTTISKTHMLDMAMSYVGLTTYRNILGYDYPTNKVPLK